MIDLEDLPTLRWDFGTTMLLLVEWSPCDPCLREELWGWSNQGQLLRQHHDQSSITAQVSASLIF